MNRVKSFQELGELELHDAILDDIELRVDRGACKISLQTYVSENSKERALMILSFEGVTSIAANLDLLSLAENARFGNVTNCRVDVKRGIVRLYLADGLLEVVASSITLSESL